MVSEKGKPKTKRTNYQRGADTERWVMRWLRKNGHPYQMRSAGSKGGFDIASWDGMMWHLIQVKRGHNPAPRHFREMSTHVRAGDLNRCTRNAMWFMRVDPRKEPRLWRWYGVGWRETTCDELTRNS